MLEQVSGPILYSKTKITQKVQIDKHREIFNSTRPKRIY